MKQARTLYNFIYWDFITAIYVGVLKKGDSLPTLPDICQQYQVGRNTVRMAIKQLEDNGYVRSQLRKPPIVCFDLDNPQFRTQYIQEFARRRELLLEAFDVIVLVMPGIVENALSHASKSQRMEIAECIGQCSSKLVAATETELSEQLYAVYGKAVGLAGNTLLDQFFSSLYQAIIIPLSDSMRKDIVFKLLGPVIKATLLSFKKKVEVEDYKGIEKQLVRFCAMIKKNADNHLNMVCQGVVSKEKEKFDCFSRMRDEISYMILVTETIDKIRTGEYGLGKMLPSYAQLAKTAEVSEKTSRKAIEILNKLGLVETVNGIGTRVLSKENALKGFSFNDAIMQKNMIRFLEAWHLLNLLCYPVMIRELSTFTDEEITALKESIVTQKDILVSHIFDSVFGHTPDSIMQATYQRLRPMLVWGFFLKSQWTEFIGEQDNFATRILNMLEERNFEGMAVEVDHISRQAFDLAKTHAQAQGLVINLYL